MTEHTRGRTRIGDQPRALLAESTPNTYEDPGCRETDYPCERIFSFFSAFFGRSVVTWQHVLT